MATLPERIEEVARQVAATQAMVYGTSLPGQLYPMIGSLCVFGCKVTAGFSEGDMLLALEGGIDHINPERIVPASRHSEYSNVASVDGFGFYSEDRNKATVEDISLMVAAAPSAGFHRSDVVFLYFGPQGAAVGIKTGTSVPTSTVTTLPALDKGVLALARVDVAGGVTGIPNSAITDLRNFTGRLKGEKGDVALRPRGTWLNVTAYAVNDLVERNNNLYLAIVLNTGAPPEAHPEAWLLFLHNDQTAAAASYAETARIKAQAAIDSAAAAVAARDVATTKAGQAGDSATAADQAKTVAVAKAGEASDSAAAAIAARDEAITKAGQAGDSATAADQAKTVAVAKAGEAGDSAAVAVAARDVAVAAENAAAGYAAQTLGVMGVIAGEVRGYCGSVAPAGWALCQGQLLNIADHPALWAVLGTGYGGDGITTFALPTLESYYPRGGRIATIEAGDAFTAHLPRAIDATYVALAGDGPGQVATGLAAAIEASAGYAEQAFSVTSDAEIITLTAKVAGTGFDVTVSTATAPQLIVVTANDVDVVQVDQIAISGTKVVAWPPTYRLIYLG